MDKLKIVFAGTPEIAATVLDKLISNKFNVELVLTQPDRPAGRGMKLVPSAVKQLAVENDIEVYQPVSFKKEPESIEKIESIAPDIMIVVAYGLILPQELLNIPRLGCINIHVSLLPKWRGAAPIQRAILAGDSMTGVTIMQMDAGLDTGDILLVERLPIEDGETSLSLHNKLAHAGAKKVIEYLNNYSTIKPQKQSSDGVTYADKILKSEGVINWNEPAELVERKIRGYNPFPGMSSYLDGKLYKFWFAQIYPEKIDKKYVCGEIIKAQKDLLVIACGNDSFVKILEIQESGNKRKTIEQFLQNKSDLVGKIFNQELSNE